MTDNRLQSCTRLTSYLTLLLIASCKSPSDGGLELPEETADAAVSTETDDTDAAAGPIDDAGHVPLLDASDPTTGEDTGVGTDNTSANSDNDGTAHTPHDADVTVSDAAGPQTTNDSDALDAGANEDDGQTATDTTSGFEPDAATASDDALDAGLNAPSDGSASPAPLDDAGWPQEPSCVYQSPPIVSASWLDAGADAGPDAGPPPGPHLQLLSSPFLGPYLGDHAGYALYIYTADFPGDCEAAPISTCYDDCAISWPIFDAGERELGEGLEPGVFGSFVRDDGRVQTTYYGWPLYYYKKDLEPQDTLGQGKGKIWFLAEQVLPNLVSMRAPETAGGVKYLADGRGHTLYAYDGDLAGDDSKLPRVACTAECLDEVEPFSVRSLRAVTTLEPDELSIFVRPEGRQQVSFRGQPLYLSKADERSGEMNGLLGEGFRLVEP